MYHRTEVYVCVGGGGPCLRNSHLCFVKALRPSIEHHIEEVDNGAGSLHDHDKLAVLEAMTNNRKYAVKEKIICLHVQCKQSPQEISCAILDGFCGPEFPGKKDSFKE